MTSPHEPRGFIPGLVVVTLTALACIVAAAILGGITQ